MFADERRAKIADMVRKNHSVSSSELTETFRVSLETIRRDLESMEEQGLLKRVHGGAISVGKLQSYHDLSLRSEVHQPQKRRLCLAACSCMKNGDFIALDSGSTAYELAKLICERSESFTVLTHSLEVFEILSENANIRTILAGGFYHPEEKCFYGHPALDMLRQFHVGKSFIAPSAISLGFGISDHLHKLIEIQRAIMGISDEVYVLVDSSKFETCAPFQICGLNTGHTYLTDSDLPDDIYEAYQKTGINIKK